MDMTTSIKNKLREIEEQENVRIIMAVESGSRAWGFDSPDSDYDVRFIYIRKEEEYLKLLPVRDVIEWQLDDVYDVSGWDLKKALILLHDSNPTLHEWCNSPIVYLENALADDFRELTQQHFLPKKALFHYLNMAERTFRMDLQSQEVRLKKYFYALRPILAARWVAEYRTPPPMLFDELVADQLPAELEKSVQDLRKQKRQMPEIGKGSRISELDEFIIKQMDNIRELAQKEENRKNSWGLLDAFFRAAVTCN